MKVLLVSLFHPELVRGGAQQVCLELFEGLKAETGVEPTMLSAIDPSFSSLYKSGARITGFDGRPGEHLFLSRDYDYWWHKNGDLSVREAFAEFLDLVQPDVIHFHHFLLLGLDLISLARKTLPNVRIVLTLHEFLTLCVADGQMVRTTDRSLCSRPSPVRCHQCRPDRSPEEFFMRELWVKQHLSHVDVFTTPSQFMIERFVDWGLERTRIVHVTNGQRDYAKGFREPSAPARRNRFGFFGQLVDNKGVQVLLDAVEQLRQEGFEDFTVEINGDNLRYATEDARAAIAAYQESQALLPPMEQRVRFNGSYHVDELAQRMARVDWVVVPSVWWEVFGLVISEAWMFGRPVIVSAVGGPGERVKHEVDGLQFATGDVRALAQAIRRAASEDGLWDRLSAGITAPASREVMTRHFLEVYRGVGGSEAPGATPVVAGRSSRMLAGRDAKVMASTDAGKL
ncbi:MAG TPA: glycosyltransferase family 4 protein [Caulobacteraceae bacterium]|jgi:glycosyltransferase involved in cell wall biosynthesis|nr:glycosyltransferase family 4 protein [Caulobacteraceae bacterium]